MSDEADVVDWAALPEDALRTILRINYTPAALHHVAATCKSWRPLASSNEMWAGIVIVRWPEFASLQRCTSYRALHARLLRADQRLAMREAPSELSFMVCMRMQGSVVMAHTFLLSDLRADGTWVCPDLRLPDGLLHAAAADYADSEMTCFREFCEWNHAELTVTAFRPLDERIFGMLPQPARDSYAGLLCMLL
mmetsp:Transcript_14753/g.29612  ORF Transcript_14753/g.29612 Transcript_14753/m.29612 type:complete len:194 (-) Transcript_14753:84-665(-)